MLITAGPTYEAIDPVRFIGNHSSGKMGFALSEAFAQRGAEVILVSGPVSLQPAHANIRLTRVTSAAEMFEAAKKWIEKAHIAVFAAAVADFTPDIQVAQKIKRGEEDMVIRLRPTVDIAATLGKEKKEGQFFVGFALETHDGLQHAQGKLERKNLDMIVLNSLEDKGAGFGTETNRITIIDKSGNIDKFDLKLKSEVAADIVEKIRKILNDA